MASDTRDRLIRATGRLLRRQGYASTGLNQIVSEADAPKGSMYFHFPGGKAELAAAAVDRFGDRVRAQLVERLATAPTVRDAVAGYFDAYAEHLQATRYAEGCAVATVTLDAAADNDLLADAVGRAFHRWTEPLTQALEAEGRAPERAHALATLVVATIEGGIMMARALRSTEPLVATRDAVVDSFDALDALDARDGVHSPAAPTG